MLGPEIAVIAALLSISACLCAADADGNFADVRFDSISGDAGAKVSSGDLLLDIERNIDVNCDGVTISGDLDVRDINHSIIKTVRIVNSTIEGTVSFTGCDLDEVVDFSNTTFLSDSNFDDASFFDKAIFRGARFHGNASFCQTTFEGDGIFKDAQFSNYANFSYSRFERYASFINAKFLEEADLTLARFNTQCTDFMDVEFYKDAYFNVARFDGYADFSRARFDGLANFYTCQFWDSLVLENAVVKGDLRFTRSHFFKESWFDGSDFLGQAIFENVRFDGPAYLNDTKIEGQASFSSAQFGAPIDFSGTRFGGDLILEGAQISALNMARAAFRETSEIYLKGAYISQMPIRWSEIQDRIHYDPSAYLSLIKNYKDLGQTDDANNCYYQYRLMSQNQKSLSWPKFVDAVACVSCGYGVRPHRALLLGIGLIFVFALIFWLGAGLEELSGLKGVRSLEVAFYFSVLAFTANAKGLRWVGPYRYLGMLEGIIGWLLMALFLVTLGRIMIG
jgi:uncharacterized protein YjbI with pentapeptide repeats